MKRISKLLKIRFFILGTILVIVFAYISKLGGESKTQQSREFEPSYVRKAKFDAESEEEKQFFAEISPSSKKMSAGYSEEPVNYMVFSDLYTSKKIFNSTLKEYPSSKIYEIIIDDTRYFFLSSERFGMAEDAAVVVSLLESKKIHTNTFRVAGNIRI